MEPLAVVSVNEMKAILEAFSGLDEIRWNDPSNYNLINHFSDDLTSDELVLTRWLCYITDRQMPYQRIWDIGGYVISHLVYTYTHKRSKTVCDIIESYIRTDNGKMWLTCPLEG